MVLGLCLSFWQRCSWLCVSDMMCVTISILKIFESKRQWKREHTLRCPPTIDGWFPSSLAFSVPFEDMFAFGVEFNVYVIAIYQYQQ